MRDQLRRLLARLSPGTSSGALVALWLAILVAAPTAASWQHQGPPGPRDYRGSATAARSATGTGSATVARSATSDADRILGEGPASLVLIGKGGGRHASPRHDAGFLTLRQPAARLRAHGTGSERAAALVAVAVGAARGRGPPVSVHA